MKKSILAASALVLTVVNGHAAPTFNPGFAGNTYYTHTTSDNIISYDWDASDNLYYMTSAGFPDTNVWLENGNNPTNIYSEPNNFAGASVISIGDYIYFNDSTQANVQNIHNYDTTSASASASVISTTSNWGLFESGGDLFIAGATASTNQVFHSELDSNGDLVSNPATDLGTTFGSSGPLAFDAVGNMYYAPGFSDRSIYKWTAAQVNAAIADPTLNPLPTTGVLWYDYSADYANLNGGTGMIIDADGDLVLSITDFLFPSVLVEFDVDSSGNFAGLTEILSTSGRLGDARSYDGGLYVSEGNTIIEVVPEPGTASLLVAGLIFAIARRNRSKN